MPGHEALEARYHLKAHGRVAFEPPVLEPVAEVQSRGLSAFSSITIAKGRDVEIAAASTRAFCVDPDRRDGDVAEAGTMPLIVAIGCIAVEQRQLAGPPRRS